MEQHGYIGIAILAVRLACPTTKENGPRQVELIRYLLEEGSGGLNGCGVDVSY